MFRAKFAARWVGAALMLPALTLACGACVEDKMAATYDYEVSQRAAAEHRTVVYCDVQGQVDARRLRSAASQVAGLDPGSIRTSSEPAAMSFALDTKASTAAMAVAKIGAALDGSAKVTLLRAVEPGDLSAAPSRQP